jgi:hypothetical protein
MRNKFSNNIKLLFFLAPISLVIYGFSIMSYDPNLVEITRKTINGQIFNAIKFDRKDNHIKAKYFATKDNNGTSVSNRFKTWSKGRNIVSVCAGTYMNDCNANATPVSLTIDQGIIVNRTLMHMDGIVVVYASGEIVVGNVKLGDLKINDRNFDLKNPLDKNAFIAWAEKSKATVFQTHLLVYNNELTISDNSSGNVRERRFLVGCKDAYGDYYEYLVNLPPSKLGDGVTLLEGAKMVKKFLNEDQQMKSIMFLINLDTGCQDFAQVFGSNGMEKTEFSGRMDINSSVNLISFYYE